MLDELKKYRLIYEHCMNKIDSLLRKELVDFNTFLDNEIISTLPDGYYKNGEKLDSEYVRSLYDKSAQKRN
jgi:hypothetical protein